MKPKTILTFLLVVLAISEQAQTKVVELPHVAFANNRTLEISKVTLSDTETVLDVEAFFTPGNWIRVVSDTYLLSDGKKYMIRSGKGIELDSLFWMPKSGEVQFKLIFEPLPKNTRSFDFIESDCDDCFKIYGIDLEKKYLEKPIKSTIIGKVNNRPQSKRLLLAKAGADLRVNHFASIRIDSLGNFQHTLYADDLEAYMLIFGEEYGDSWFTEIFFPDADTIYIHLNPKNERIKNKFLGGKLNREYYEYYASKMKIYYEFDRKKEQLTEAGNYFAEEYSRVLAEFNAETNNEKKDSLAQIGRKLEESEKHLSFQGQQLENEYKKMSEKQTKLTFDWIAENGSLVGYYELITWLDRAVEKSKLIDVYYNVYFKKFPNHPYTVQAKDLIEGIELKVGEKFIDFTAPDSNGHNHTLSEHIKGKVAMINLWASWCGPCRRHSKELIPVFEKYKDKGFTVLGVAREYDIKSMTNAATKDGYPWLNLLELNDAQNIWAKYGAPGAGGRLVLVNKEGVILSLDPAIEETLKIVEEELNKF